MSTSAHRLMLAAAAAALLATGLTSANAVAAAPGASASGALGEVDVTVDGQTVRQQPIAPCEVDGEEQNDSGRVTVGDVATYWGGETTCGRVGDEEAEALVEGRYFVTDLLRDWGGPRIKVSAFDLTCHTTENGSAGSVELRGISGIEVPEEIPPNYTVIVEGDDDEPVAEVVLNEFTAPSPPDGSMQMNAMRIELLGSADVEASGDIVLGSVACDPFGG